VHVRTTVWAHSHGYSVSVEVFPATNNICSYVAASLVSFNEVSYLWEGRADPPDLTLVGILFGYLTGMSSTTFKCMSLVLTI